jgi:hypothetical protein
MLQVKVNIIYVEMNGKIGLGYYIVHFRGVQANDSPFSGCHRVGCFFGQLFLSCSNERLEVVVPDQVFELKTLVGNRAKLLSEKTTYAVASREWRVIQIGLGVGCM